MRLQRLLPLLQAHPSLERVLAGETTLLSAITPARPYAVAALHAAVGRPMLVVVPRPSEARAYANELTAWARDPDDVLLFPETDALPYDRLPNDAEKLAERLGTLERLAGLAQADTPPLVVASVRAAMDLVLDPQAFRDNHAPI
ncbi:MAG TPA: transcription-repair coupling factor, partial [Chloroflexota bacterium]|nr:transcription-repair coupling factor [Chloroflexota bacterium]